MMYLGVVHSRDTNFLQFIQLHQNRKYEISYLNCYGDIILFKVTIFSE